jgi:hypothetical protein
MGRWSNTRFVSPRRAATLIGVHYNTVYNWCRAAERGEQTQLAHVERDPANGYFRVSLEGVQLASEKKKL